MAACDGVVIESPYAGDVARNLAYARACMADSLRRGEYPIASHLLYTQDGILDDTVPAERELGIRAGLFWAAFGHLTAVYVDRGITEGMRQGIRHALDAGRPIELRSLDADGRATVTARAFAGGPAVLPNQVDGPTPNTQDADTQKKNRVLPTRTGSTQKSRKKRWIAPSSGSTRKSKVAP